MLRVRTSDANHFHMGRERLLNQQTSDGRASKETWKVKAQFTRKMELGIIKNGISELTQMSWMVSMSKVRLYAKATRALYSRVH